jgi:ATP-binding cassette subfamily F protein 3
VRVFPGNYEDYLWRKEGKPLPALELPAEPQPVTPAPEAQHKAARLNPIRLRQMQERCDVIEGEIEQRETEIAELENQLIQFKSAEESIRLNKILAERRSTHASLLKEWEEVSAVIGAHQ